MKRVLKANEPSTLTNYRNAVPQGSWDGMKNDPHNGGQQAYQDCRRDSIRDQNGLCAYCEIDIHDNNPLKCRVEHFHPKSDISSTHNWALDWQNMLGVCNGGCNPHVTGDGFYLPPTEENLSCDAHKDRMIQTKRLKEQCEGWISNPLQLMAFPVLFRLEKSTGFLLPDSNICANCPPWPGNLHSSMEELVQNTIDMLNLNCDRLAQERLRIIRDIENNKKRQRTQGYSPEQGLSNLARRYFRTSRLGFFTTIRLCLGEFAEIHLQSLQFQG
ncbi:MAG: retron system putative HNH endonuclease [Gammaproteobacteria bacterium]